MSDQLGAVVVGTGFGVLTHLRAMRAAGIEVKALVGRDLEKARKRAELCDVPHGLNSLDEALALPTEESAKLALRTQQILAEEFDRHGAAVARVDALERGAEESPTYLLAHLDRSRRSGWSRCGRCCRGWL